LWLQVEINARSTQVQQQLQERDAEIDRLKKEMKVRMKYVSSQHM